MSAVRAMSVVVDRARLDDARKLTSRLGGGWASAFETWAALPSMRYALMLATSRKRIRARTPVVYMVADRTALLHATRAACASLSDVTCQWVCATDDEARDLVQRELLVDAVPAGGAQ